MMVMPVTPTGRLCTYHWHILIPHFSLLAQVLAQVSIVPFMLSFFNYILKEEILKPKIIIEIGLPMRYCTFRIIVRV